MTAVAEPTDQTESSDDSPSLADAVRCSLDRTGHGWLRRIDVSIEGGCVVLRGRVPSYYLKQMAHVTVLAIPGVELIRNELEVEGGNR